ncbi:hypothetical protein DIZ76_013274 [Coccidioides immitis]|nr:hypothetical protein DIZ76_013274 [Coccidioides immitis]
MDDGRVELEGIDVGETNELAIEQYRAEIERKLVRRQDMVIMPQMVTLYLLVCPQSPCALWHR